jgi:hypothetical protein
MCMPHTVPKDFGPQLTEYTQRGYRVIAMAGRPLAGMNWQEVSFIVISCVVLY